MYPFKTDDTFVRNTWYVAALRSEVTDKPFERTICDEPVVFYRTKAGAPVAIYGLCPHHYYPLVRGRVIDDSIECGYHGYRFDCTGKCTRMPGQENKPAGFTQRTYPVIEHGPWIWIWPGDPSAASPEALPDVSAFGYEPDGRLCADWAAHMGAEPKMFKARPQLLIDNLLDLTHVPFIHGGVTDFTPILNARMTFDDLPGAGMLITRHISNVKWDDWWNYLFGSENKFDSADYILLTHFFGPALIITAEAEVVRVDGADSVSPGLGRIKYKYIHGITPETQTSGHYFWGASRNVKIEDLAFQEAHVQIVSKELDRDVVAIEAIERRVDQAASVQHELLCRGDIAAFKGRKLVQKLINDERERWHSFGRQVGHKKDEEALCNNTRPD